jgi:hypothetical protein
MIEQILPNNNERCNFLTAFHEVNTPLAVSLPREQTHLTKATKQELAAKTTGISVRSVCRLYMLIS